MYKKDTATGILTLLLTENGDHGNIWHEESVTVTSSGEFQVYLEGVEGANTNATIAVDDTGLSDGACLGKKLGIRFGGCISPLWIPALA